MIWRENTTSSATTGSATISAAATLRLDSPTLVPVMVRRASWAVW